jgi:hypothetical protein
MPKRRGRPRKFDEFLLQAASHLSAVAKTDRQRQNLFYAQLGLEALGLAPKRNGRPPPPNWLVDWEGANYGKLGAIKWGPLEQLGRMSEAGFANDDLRRLAAELMAIAAREKWTAKAAVRVLRGMRLREAEEPE